MHESVQIELMPSKLKIGCVLLVGGNALGACGGEVGLVPASTGGYTADGDGAGGAHPGSGGVDGAGGYPGFVGNIGSGGASYGTGGVPGFLGVPIGTAPTGGAPGTGGTENEGGLGGGS